MTASSGRPVPVGVVDPRPLVRVALEAALRREPTLRVIGSFAGWAEVADPGTTVWIGPLDPAGGRGDSRRVDVEDLDVADLPGLTARVHAAAAGPPTGADHRPPPLSAREDAALSDVAAGVPAARTAADLGISTRAVQAARQRAMSKLGVSTQVEAVRLAHELRSAGVRLTRVPAPRAAPDDGAQA